MKSKQMEEKEEAALAHIWLANTPLYE